MSFGINKGMQTIVASKPIPLSDPLADRNLKLGPNGVGSIVGKKEPLVRFKKPPQVEYALENNRLYPIAGDVAARIKFNPDGRFGDIVVTFASPHPAFAEEVVRAAPPLEVETLDGGAPGVDVYVCLPLKFRPAP